MIGFSSFGQDVLVCKFTAEVYTSKWKEFESSLNGDEENAKLTFDFEQMQIEQNIYDYRDDYKIIYDNEKIIIGHKSQKYIGGYKYVTIIFDKINMSITRISHAEESEHKNIMSVGSCF